MSVIRPGVINRIPAISIMTPSMRYGAGMRPCATSRWIRDIIIIPCAFARNAPMMPVIITILRVYIVPTCSCIFSSNDSSINGITMNAISSVVSIMLKFLGFRC